MTVIDITAYFMMPLYATALVYVALLRRRLTHAIENLREHRETNARARSLAIWAQQTSLTVTNRSAVTFSCTLAELHDDPRGSERHWADPIAISLWGGCDELVNELHDTAEKQHG